MISSRRNLLLVTILFSFFVILYILLIPHSLYLQSDDFGYLESFISSLQQKHLVTSSFLEPLNYFTTLFSIAIFKLTGSMYLATLGTVYICGLAIFSLIWYLFSDIGGLFRGFLAAMVAVTFPVYMNMSIDYTGVMASWMLFLVSVIFWKKKNYFIFTLLVLVAMFNRQSMMILVVFPFFELLRKFRIKGKFDWRVLFSFLILSCSAVFVILNSRQTLAQKISWDLNLSSWQVFFNIRRLYSFATGIYSFIFVLFCSYIIFQPGDLKRILRRNLINLNLPLIISSIFVFLCYLFPDFVSFQTPIFNEINFASLFLKILFILSVWFLPWQDFSFSTYLLVAVSYIAVIALRVIWYDYYLWELFILGFFYLKEKKFISISSRSSGISSRLDYIVLTVFLIFNLLYGYNFKVLLDQNALKLTVSEKLMRKRKIPVTAISDTSLGYIGWKLFSYISHRFPDRETTFFFCFVHLSDYDLFIKDKNYVWDDSDKNLVLDGATRIGFFSNRYFVVKRDFPRARISNCSNPDKLLPQQLAGYQARMYPLTDSEWRSYLDFNSGRFSSSSK